MTQEVMTPLEMAVAHMERETRTRLPGPVRDFAERLIAVAASYLEYDPDWELANYKQGFKDSTKIHLHEQTVS